MARCDLFVACVDGVQVYLILGGRASALQLYFPGLELYGYCSNNEYFDLFLCMCGDRALYAGSGHPFSSTYLVLQTCGVA